MTKRLLLAVLFVSLSNAAVADNTVKVETDNGIIVGRQADGIQRFLGIPYARQPVGERRWRKPLPPEPWQGKREAVAFGPACPQPGDNFSGSDVGPTDEACLYLNIWAPAQRDKPLPVMVWLHGGAHRIGAASLPIYRGGPLASRDVVVVTLNYRLGYLGYFSHAALAEEGESGNFGLQDEIRALSWIQKHIGAFGGDPSRITIFGESAGAVDVLYLMSSPAAQGLFQQAIVQSGGGWAKPSTEAALRERINENFETEGIPTDIDATGLRNIPPEQLVRAQSHGKKLGFGPFIDGRIVPQAPRDAFAAGEQAAVPLIIGSNSWEGNLTRVSPPGFMARMLVHIPPFRGVYADRAESSELRTQLLFGDVVFGAPSLWIARHHQRLAPTYLYYFDYVRESLRATLPGAGHGREIIYAFDTLGMLGNRRGAVSDNDRAIASAMADCWAAFGNTGAPACKFPKWSAFTAEQPAVLVIDPAPTLAAKHPLTQAYATVEEWFGPGQMLDR